MNPTVQSAPSFSDEQLKGFCVIADACVAALMNVPDAGTVASMRQVAEALGAADLFPEEADAALEQRFYDRFFVSSHPAYVPLYEDSVRSGYEDEGLFRYGTTDGRYFEHTLKCYQAVGFDYRKIGGFELEIQRLKPDSLASELSFLSSLAASAVAAGDEAVRRRSEELFVSFAAEHPNRWFDKAVTCLERYEDDFYARVCAIAADAVAAMVEPEGDA